MRTLTKVILWQRLQEKGLVVGTLPLDGKTESLWYVRVMLGAAGWIGSLFLLGFVGVGLSFVLDSGLASMIGGLLACGGAFAIFSANRDSDFVTQFGLAVSLVGQMLLIYGLYELLGRDGWQFYCLVFVIEVILAVVMPNFIFRMIAGMGATLAFALAINSAGVYGVASSLIAAGFALIWLQDIRWYKHCEICRPIGYGFALSLLFYRGGLLWGRGLWWPRTHNGANEFLTYAPLFGKMLLIGIFLAVVVLLLKRLQIPLVSKAGCATLVGAVLVMAAAFSAPGITTALLILLVGYAVRNLVLVGIGLLALGGFLSNYYYMMQSTLLIKSMLLVGFGAALIISRLLLQYWLPAVAVRGEGDA